MSCTCAVYYCCSNLLPAVRDVTINKNVLWATYKLPVLGGVRVVHLSQFSVLCLVFFVSSSCVPNVASFSGLSILYCPFNVYLIDVEILYSRTTYRNEEQLVDNYWPFVCYQNEMICFCRTCRNWKNNQNSSIIQPENRRNGSKMDTAPQLF